MVRAILGVIVGYLVIAVFVVGMFFATSALLGPDLVFKQGTYDPSTLWLVLSFGLSLIGAILGGVVCRVIARSMQAVYWFAGVVILLGVLLAIPSLAGDDEPLPPRTGEPDPAVLNQLKTPPAAALLTPVIAAIGVIVGGMLAERRSARAAKP